MMRHLALSYLVESNVRVRVSVEEDKGDVFTPFISLLS